MIRDAFSGGCGAVCLVYTGIPFEVVKVRLQTQQKGVHIYTGPFQTAVRIVQEEGLSALWKGAMPGLVSASIENVAVFAANGFLRKLVAGSQSENLSVKQEFVLGGLSGVVSATAITPPEMVKVRLQSQRDNTAYRNGWNVCESTIKSEGFHGLFRGLAATLSRDIPYNMVQFGLYHNCCLFWRQHKGLKERSDLGLLDSFLIGVS
jgi:hypothetical protein